MKVLFLHYAFKKDGITRVVLNNVKGLTTCSDNLKFIFAGDYFEPSIPQEIEKRYIDWNATDILSQIQKVTKDADIVIIENPTVGEFPKITLMFKEYVEKNPDKKIIYRIHDFIDDRPHFFKDFKKIASNFDEIYPRSNNVSFLTLTSFDKKRLLQKGLKNVKVLPNSIVASDLNNTKEKSFDLRNTFEKEKIINPNEKILLYPVRVLRRKNIEEAMLLTKLLNQESDHYRLIVTIAYDEDYRNEIESLAKDYEIPCSIGKVSKHISFDKKEKYSIADLYSISDLVVSTSRREGFGLAFIEPWLAGKPVIGRKIPYVSEDLESKGIDLSCLYDNDFLKFSEDTTERVKEIRLILSDISKLRQLSVNLDIPKRIRKASDCINKNCKAIKKHYNHVNIAKQLLCCITN